ncbi:MAG: hypothetical protein ACODAU_07030 [Myxococcota bacterium]
MASGDNGVPVRLVEDAGARLVAFDGQIFTLRSPRAFAPGAPVRFSVALESEARALEGRSIGSRRLPDGGFEVRLRAVNLRRADREHLRALLA